MSPNLNAAGIVDLSQIKAKQEAERAIAHGASFVVDMTMANAQEIISGSMQHIVIVEFHSEQADAAQFSADLAQVTNAAGGRWLLARVDVDDQDSLAIAQQFQGRAVPTVMALIGGQVAPLWEGTLDRAAIEAQLAQVVQVAAQAGITGMAQPMLAEGAEPGPDPRFAKADELIEAGDWAGARAEYDRLLNQYPGDPDVLAGRASVGLLQRNAGAQPDAVLQAATDRPDDVDAQLAAADIEMQVGREAQAYERLVGLVRRTSGAERERVRQRLLELFDMTGNTPAVLKARRDLMTALF